MIRRIKILVRATATTRITLIQLMKIPTIETIHMTMNVNKLNMSVEMNLKMTVAILAIMKTIFMIMIRMRRITIAGRGI